MHAAARAWGHLQAAPTCSHPQTCGVMDGSWSLGCDHVRDEVGGVSSSWLTSSGSFSLIDVLSARTSEAVIAVGGGSGQPVCPVQLMAAVRGPHALCARRSHRARAAPPSSQNAALPSAPSSMMVSPAAISTSLSLCRAGRRQGGTGLLAAVAHVAVRALEHGRTQWVQLRHPYAHVRSAARMRRHTTPRTWSRWYHTTDCMRSELNQALGSRMCRPSSVTSLRAGLGRQLWAGLHASLAAAVMGCGPGAAARVAATAAAAAWRSSPLT